MNNDLISRSALKEEIENLIGYSLSYEALLNAIENAPTVEQKYYERIIAQINPVIEERPQGEWKRHDEWVNGIYVGGFYHANCPNENGYYSKWTTNYCPNCGAKMQQGD